MSLTLLAPGGFGEEINGPLLRRYAAAVSADEIRSMPRRDVRTAKPGVAKISCRMVGNACATCPARPTSLIEIADAITRDDRQGVIPRDSLVDA